MNHVYIYNELRSLVIFIEKFMFYLNTLYSSEYQIYVNNAKQGQLVHDFAMLGERLSIYFQCDWYYPVKVVK